MDQAREFRSKIGSALKNPAGQGLIEYSLILLLVALVIVVALRELGTTVNSTLYEPVNSAVTNAGR
ncbi:MAG: hypothetical protein A2075_00955 [Geobacteraceae bacterium GWC2_58_44]|nr:MAG: hypothetical protein A2075_00955 [Geobacteraceae bacterium GWC2_58_44]HBG07414.1 Flp family type IVb pilin [Geobacter sp.]